MHVRDVQHARLPRFDSWMSRGLTQKRTGSFTFLPKTSNPCLKRVYKESTRDFVHFERSFSMRTRLIMMRNREVQILENFIKRFDSIFFFAASESNPYLGIVATTRWTARRSRSKMQRKALISLARWTKPTAVKSPEVSMLYCTQH